jgi:hypothetical protein
MQLTVVITGLHETKGRLTALGKAFGNFTPELTVLGKELKSYYGNDVFISEGEPFGGWVALKESTMRQKSRTGFGNRGILEASGDLQDSFYYDVAPQCIVCW